MIPENFKELEFSDHITLWEISEKFSFTGKISSPHWVCTFLNGNLHSFNDEPAVIGADGSKQWYKNGVRHREGDEPAVISNGNLYWYKDGELRRENGLSPVMGSNDS